MMNLKRWSRQKGVIFLALILVMFVTGGTLALSALNNRQSTEIAAQSELHYQMAAAKAALLAYAASSARLNSDLRGPGFFPCPDTDNDGLPQSTCNSNIALVGRLPQYEDFSGSRFPFNDTYANVDRQFWYVVGPRYVYHTTTAGNRRSRLRTNAISTLYAAAYWLTLDGTPEYVALIIAPGDELTTQTRSTGATSYANYLDGQNGASGFNYFTSYSSNPELFNDQVIGITLDEYIKTVGAVIAGEIKETIDIYAAANADAYPVDSGSLTSTSCPSSTTGTTFSNLFDSGHVWLRDASISPNGNNNERWSCASGVYWDRHTSLLNTGDLKFNGCTNLSFTLKYDYNNTIDPEDEIVLNGTSC